MSDLDRFIELYRSFGIECVVNHRPDGSQAIVMGDDGARPDEDALVTRDPRLEGYTFFYTIYEFDGGGKFLGQGAYE